MFYMECAPIHCVHVHVRRAGSENTEKPAMVYVRVFVCASSAGRRRCARGGEGGDEGGTRGGGVTSWTVRARPTLSRRACHSAATRRSPSRRRFG